MTVSHDDPVLLRIGRRPPYISIDPYGRTAVGNSEEPRERAPIPGKIADVCWVPEDVLDGDGSPQSATASGPFRPSARGDAIAIQATSDKSGSPAALHEKREDPLDGLDPHFFARREEASIALGDNVWFTTRAPSSLCASFVEEQLGAVALVTNDKPEPVVRCVVPEVIAVRWKPAEPGAPR